MTDQGIKVSDYGPYLVRGKIPLVRKSQVSSEHGEPMTWQKTADLDTADEYKLCRCGESKEKPFCDNSHRKIDFDGADAADNDTYEQRKVVHPGSTDIVIKRDYSVCADSGFCGNRLANIKKLARGTDDSIVRAQVMAMIERCPSGSYAYALSDDGENIEPDLPLQIAATTEMTSEGPIQGPIWVTGYVNIERADGQLMEVRNRVTLCRCGASKNKPLCDGTHRSLMIRE